MQLNCISGVHSERGGQRLGGAGERLQRALEDCPAIFPTGRGLRLGVRHDPGAAVHGRLLLPPEAVRRRPPLPELDQVVLLQRRHLQLQLRAGQGLRRHVVDQPK